MSSGDRAPTTAHWLRGVQAPCAAVPVHTVADALQRQRAALGPAVTAHYQQQHSSSVPVSLPALCPSQGQANLGEAPCILPASTATLLSSPEPRPVPLIYFQHRHVGRPLVSPLPAAASFAPVSRRTSLSRAQQAGGGCHVSYGREAHVSFSLQRELAGGAAEQQHGTDLARRAALQLGEAEGKAKGRTQPGSRKPTAGTAPGERQLQGQRSPTFLMQESKGELVGCRVPAQSPCSCAPHSTAPALHPTATLLPRSDETSRHQRGGNGASTAGDAHSQPVGRSQSAEDAKSLPALAPSSTALQGLVSDCAPLQA